MPPPVSRLVVASVGFAVALIAARIAVPGDLQFAFLLWNLFLASVPLVLSRGLARFERPGWLALGVGSAWLLFFPNAPYILTDLVHLRVRPEAPYWFDLVLLLAAAWSGMLVGMVSLAEVHGTVRRWHGARAGWSVAVGALVLGSSGVYLGRVLRWNSWDVLTAPGALLGDEAAPQLDPIGHTRAEGMTLQFSVLLTLCYLALRPLTDRATAAADATAP